MKVFYKRILFLLIYAIYAQSYKILVFSPTISRSHMMSNARVADTLAKDGHDVTLLEVEFFVPVNSLNASKNASVLKVQGSLANNPILLPQLTSASAFNDGPTILQNFQQQNAFVTLLNEACTRFLEDKITLIEELKAKNFDLFIGEQLTLCGSGLSHLIGIPIHVLLSSCPIQQHVSSFLGLPHPLSYVPSISGIDLSDKMTIFERIRNMVSIWAGNVAFNFYGTEKLTQIFRSKFGYDFPHLNDIAKNSPLVFVNVDEVVDFPRPLFSNIVYVGGLEIEKNRQSQKQLQEPFESEMKKGANGVVLFSFGSAVNTGFLDKRFLVNLYKAIESIPEYHFIVKIDKNDNFSREISAKISNIFLTNWAPQATLLAHPRMKMFVTHGGYNSLLEAAQNAIPIITMGFFADQFRNGRVAERNGWGIAFDKNLLLYSTEEFKETILKIRNDLRYTENAKRTSKLLRTKPFSAEERLTKNIRFLEMNGGKLPELLSESRNFSVFVANNLDIILLFLTGTLVLLVMSFIFIKSTYEFLTKILNIYAKSKSD